MTEIPTSIMLDNDALNDLQDNTKRLLALSNSEIQVKVTVKQWSEFRDGVDKLPEERRDLILRQRDLVEKQADPEWSGVDTTIYGESYGSNYGGVADKICQELLKDQPNIEIVHYPDAVGAEAAINRGLPFVTGDKALEKKMRACNYEEHLLPLENFRVDRDNY